MRKLLFENKKINYDGVEERERVKKIEPGLRLYMFALAEQRGAAGLFSIEAYVSIDRGGKRGAFKKISSGRCYLEMPYKDKTIYKVNIEKPYTLVIEQSCHME